MAKGRWIALLPLLGILNVPAAAQTPPAKADLPRSAEEGEALRKRRIAEIDGQLQRGEWDGAQATLRSRLDALLRGDNENPGPGLGETLARLAVAEAGLGREDDAIWHWHAAQGLDPYALSAEQLHRFGTAGAVLERHPLRRLSEAPAGVAVRRSGDPGGAFVPPRRIDGGIPPPPAGSEEVPFPEWLRLQVVVGPDGRASQPVVERSTSLRLTYRVLEALRSWRFEPARLGGEPVAAFQEVQVNPPADQPPLEQLLQPVGEIAEIGALLRAGQWAKADKRADRLWLTGFHGNLQSRVFYALALTFRALAEAGLGPTDEAICRWQAAQALDPRLFHVDLAAYGAPGELLERHRWGLTDDGHSISQLEAQEGGEVQRPEIRKRVEPLYPEFRKANRVEGMVITEGVIDERGAIRHLRVLRGGPGLDFDVSALDAVCQWRFAPALFKKAPVKVYYALTVNYKVK